MAVVSYVTLLTLLGFHVCVSNLWLCMIECLPSSRVSPDGLDHSSLPTQRRKPVHPLQTTFSLLVLWLYSRIVLWFPDCSQQSHAKPQQWRLVSGVIAVLSITSIPFIVLFKKRHLFMYEFLSIFGLRVSVLMSRACIWKPFWLLPGSHRMVKRRSTSNLLLSISQQHRSGQYSKTNTLLPL